MNTFNSQIKVDNTTAEALFLQRKGLPTHYNQNKKQERDNNRGNFL